MFGSGKDASRIRWRRRLSSAEASFARKRNKSSTIAAVPRSTAAPDMKLFGVDDGGCGRDAGCGGSDIGGDFDDGVGTDGGVEGK